MKKKLCVVGRGASLLSKKLGSTIDNHDIIIRANHIPDKSKSEMLGTKTDIVSTRDMEKLTSLLKIIKNEKIWICIDAPHLYSDFNCNNFEFMKKNEMDYLRPHFKNIYSKTKILKPRYKLDFHIPDTGITTIMLALMRFPDYDINICGFDLYNNGNNSIHGTSYANASIFLTPVLQEIILIKKLIKKAIIKEL